MENRTILQVDFDGYLYCQLSAYWSLIRIRAPDSDNYFNRPIKGKLLVVKFPTIKLQNTNPEKMRSIFQGSGFEVNYPFIMMTFPRNLRTIFTHFFAD